MAVAAKARSFLLGPLHPFFSITEFLEDLFEDFLPHDAHIKASGRVHISLTHAYGKCDPGSSWNRIVSEFRTRKELIEVRITIIYILTVYVIAPVYQLTNLASRITVIMSDICMSVINYSASPSPPTFNDIINLYAPSLVR